MTHAPAQPLWWRFAQMTPEEAQAEWSLEIARLETGEMSDAEADERAAAWGRAGEWQLAQADILKKELQRRRSRSDQIVHLPLSAIVGRHVELRQQGYELVGQSPFDARSKIYVSDKKGLWFELPRGRRGNAADFLKLISARQ
jgi:hypothetical protein